MTGPVEWVAVPFSTGIFPTQGSNPGLPHGRRILYQLSYQGSPRRLEWVAYPFSRGFFDPGSQPGSPALQADSLLAELPGKPCIYPEIHKWVYIYKYIYLYKCMKAEREGLVNQSCLILCDPLDCRPPGSSVHEVLQPRILE